MSIQNNKSILFPYQSSPLSLSIYLLSLFEHPTWPLLSIMLDFVFFSLSWIIHSQPGSILFFVVCFFLKTICYKLVLFFVYSFTITYTFPLFSSLACQAQWGRKRRRRGVLSNWRGDSRILPQLAAIPHRDQPLWALLPTQPCAGCPAEGPGHTKDHQRRWVSQLCWKGVCVGVWSWGFDGVCS